MAKIRVAIQMPYRPNAKKIFGEDDARSTRYWPMWNPRDWYPGETEFDLEVIKLVIIICKKMLANDKENGIDAEFLYQKTGEVWRVMLQSGNSHHGIIPFFKEIDCRGISMSNRRKSLLTLMSKMRHLQKKYEKAATGHETAERNTSA